MYESHPLERRASVEASQDNLWLLSEREECEEPPEDKKQVLACSLSVRVNFRAISRQDMEYLKLSMTECCVKKAQKLYAD